MRALTLCQPCASAIVAGPKRVENRSWPVPRTVPLPAVIAVHAGASTRPDGPIRALWPGCPPRAQLPHRAVLGAMRVVRCVELGSSDPALQSPWAVGPICWVIDRIWVLPEPIPLARGGLGLWRLEARAPGADRALSELVAGS